MKIHGDNTNFKVHILLLTKQFDPEVPPILDQLIRLLETRADLFQYYFTDP